MSSSARSPHDGHSGGNAPAPPHNNSNPNLNATALPPPPPSAPIAPVPATPGSGPAPGATSVGASTNAGAAPGPAASSTAAPAGAKQLDATLKTQSMDAIENTMRTTLPTIMNKPLVSVPAETFLQNKPAAPCFWYYNRESVFSLPAVYVDVTVSIHLSTAIISMRVAFANTSDRPIDGVFALPLKGTVTAIQAKIGQDRYVQSEIINTEDMLRLNSQLAPPRVSRQIPLENINEYVPDLFRLPILGVNAKEVVQIEVDYVESLSFFQGSYGFNLPLSFPAGLRPDPSAIAIRGSVFAMSSQVRIMSASHALEVTNMGTHKRFNVIIPSTEEAAAAEASALALLSDAEAAAAAANFASAHSGSDAGAAAAAAAAPPLDIFNLHFELPLGDISGSLLKSVDRRTEILGADGRVESVREEGSFVAFVTPPSVDRIEKQFRRNFVFLIDRSGSMVGQPFEEALRGLRVALSKLGPYDKFNIMAFDHNMMALHEDMVPATARNVEVAFNWVREKKPTFGGTTIEAPLRWALSLLGKIQKGLNFVFLLTDGAVENDREICRMVVQAAGNTRILTFGIGTYCNWYFLQMLASLTRGFNANVVYHEQIYEQVTMLLSMAELPVLTDLTMDIENVDDCQLYPFPLPDLFLGAPLVVAGKYSAVRGFPAGITLRGDDAAGMSQTVFLPVSEDPSVPVARVFLKQRMDLLIAKAWLEDTREIKQEVIDLSIKSRIPSPFTTMVTFEMSPSERAKYEQEMQRAGKEEDETRTVKKTREADERERAQQKGDGTATAAEEDEDAKASQQQSEAKRLAVSRAMLSNSERRTEYIAATAIGAVVAVGAVAAVFGNVGATMTNAASAIAGGFGTVAANALGCCNECDCDCIVDVFQGMGDCC